MVILSPIILLLLTTLALLTASRLQRPFRYQWLLAAVGALLAWAVMLFLRGRMPLEAALADWQPESLFAFSPQLSLNTFTWPFALAVASIALAVILTDISRSEQADWPSWAGVLAMSALGILSVLAGNLLTLMLAWTLIDMLELGLVVARLRSEDARQGAVMNFATSVFGTLLVLWGQLNAQSPLDLENIPPESALLLLLGLGFRLGVLPLGLFLFLEAPQRRGLGTMLRLIPVAASLVLVVRIAAVGVTGSLAPYLLLLLLLSALYGAFSWLLAANELVGRSYWILALASLAFAAAVRGQPAASLGWSLALLYLGPQTFLANIHDRKLIPIALLGLFSLSTLPFSPTRAAADFYGSPLSFFSIGYLIVQGLLLLGFIRHTLQRDSQLLGSQRWVWIIYPAGLTLLPLTFLLSDIFPLAEFQPSLAGFRWWPAAGTLLVAVLAFLLSNFTRRIPLRPLIILDEIFSLRWLYRVMWWLYRLAGRLVAIPVALLEGEGGVIWTLLFVALVLSLMAQIGPGG